MGRVADDYAVELDIDTTVAQRNLQKLVQLGFLLLSADGRCFRDSSFSEWQIPRTPRRIAYRVGGSEEIRIFLTPAIY
jgi:hypothetical protein